MALDVWVVSAPSTGGCVKCDACRELAPEAVQVVDAVASGLAAAPSG